MMCASRSEEREMKIVDYKKKFIYAPILRGDELASLGLVGGYLKKFFMI
jgi:hypothetical protein